MELFSPWTKAMDIVFYVSMFDRLLCTEAGISKNYWRNKLRFTWGWAEVLSVASYQIVNRLAWAELFSMPLLCGLSSDNPREFGGKSKDDCITLSQPLGSLHWLYSSHYLSAGGGRLHSTVAPGLDHPCWTPPPIPPFHLLRPRLFFQPAQN